MSHKGLSANFSQFPPPSGDQWSDLCQCSLVLSVLQQQINGIIYSGQSFLSGFCCTRQYVKMYPCCVFQQFIIFLLMIWINYDSFILLMDIQIFFYFFIMNKAAINIFVPVFSWVYVFIYFNYMCRNGIIGLGIGAYLHL